MNDYQRSVIEKRITELGSGIDKFPMKWVYPPEIDNLWLCICESHNQKLIVAVMAIQTNAKDISAFSITFFEDNGITVRLTVPTALELTNE